jgi:transketolase
LSIEQQLFQLTIIFDGQPKMEKQTASSLRLTDEMFRRAKSRLLKMHFDAGVGHIGGNLSIFDTLILIVVENLGRGERVILSKGHSAGALYVSLWMAGQLEDQDLDTFHQDNTKLPGHPPSHGLPHTPFATGSLGHGLSLACGLALGKRFAKKTDRVFCLTSDGEWQEGSTWEAFIFACHNKLNNLTVLIDQNGLQGFGSTNEIASMNNLSEKFAGFAVDVFCIDGHDHDAIRDALEKTSGKFSVVILKTVKGNGISFMENQMEWHYLPLSNSQFERAMLEVNSF